MNSDWLKDVTWLGPSNQSASFQLNIAMLKLVCDVGFCHRNLIINVKFGKVDI